MFLKLDEDGSNTLDMGEITALFKENGINMTKEQISNMFCNALRMNLVNLHRKQV
jgi:hypothetical protein